MLVTFNWSPTQKHSQGRYLLMVSLSGTSYRKWNNIVLAARNLLSHKNNKAYLLKLLLQMIALPMLIKPQNLWQIRQWHSNLVQHTLVKSQLYCTVYKSFYQMRLPICLSYKILSRVLWTYGQSMTFCLELLDGTFCRFWHCTIFCHTIHWSPNDHLDEGWGGDWNEQWLKFPFLGP